MFCKIHENYELKKCRSELAQMVENKELFIYSKNFDYYRGNIPKSCSYNNFYSFLETIEAVGYKKKDSSTPTNIILRNVLAYNIDKLKKFKL
jgi:hypothetical protein